ncbi:tripartite motif-containing protein 16-like protein isoform X2 [Tachysurus fulvidraco]|uniref:tripartite motif-containing protein 16-like protein isoform X2 n=1 Tax=Tachysurus fulvidraco TaxID=1234273 RepID=UPI001FEE2E46|nr:tripartite motif-containing protein 16-like protein isoform X2 [Tachysurus fulvidraco]
MAEASISVYQDHFSCPVCLDLLNDPVTTPCGHSFCKVCINAHWDQEDVKGVYSCPQCRETFTPRPVLRRNNMLAEVVEELKKTELQAVSPAVSAKAERTKKQNELKEDQIKSQQRIQEKQKKVQELKQTVDIIKIRSQAAVDDNERIFTEMISSIEKKRSEVTELIRAQEKDEVSRAERLLNQLEQEIADLKRRVTELEQLSHTHDDIHFLQSFPSLCVSPGCDDSPSFTVNQHLSFDGVRKSLSDLKKRVEQICEKKFNKIRPQAVQMILPSEPKSREDFLQYFCYLTLDPNTAHPDLILSETNRVVTLSKTQQRYSDHPERFDSWPQVLCKESVCGRCYWEVEWSDEVLISVSYKEISRKGRGDECGFGHNSQSWCLWCSSSSVTFYHNNIETELRGPSSSRIGVYVDHNAGTLSFYIVSDTMRLLHRVHTTFTQPLYAGVCVWSYNSSVRFL